MSLASLPNFPGSCSTCQVDAAELMAGDHHHGRAEVAPQGVDADKFEGAHVLFCVITEVLVVELLDFVLHVTPASQLLQDWREGEAEGSGLGSGRREFVSHRTGIAKAITSV